MRARLRALWDALFAPADTVAPGQAAAPPEPDLVIPVESFPPYQELDRCPKCGWSGGFVVRYQRPSAICSAFSGAWLVAEHLMQTCGRCGYCLVTQPAEPEPIIEPPAGGPH